MRVRWRYTTEESQPYYLFTDYNRVFIQLANIIHSGGLTPELENLLEGVKRGKNCTAGDSPHLYDIPIEVSAEPIFREEISEASLEAAAELYFGLTFCPDFDPEVVTFYRDLFDRFSPETILKSLARILFTANKNRLTEHYRTAKTLWDKTGAMLGLQYREIALLTTGREELELYRELTDHQHISGDELCEDIEGKCSD